MAFFHWIFYFAGYKITALIAFTFSGNVHSDVPEASRLFLRHISRKSAIPFSQITRNIIYVLTAYRLCFRNHMLDHPLSGKGLQL